MEFNLGQAMYQYHGYKVQTTTTYLEPVRTGTVDTVDHAGNGDTDRREVQAGHRSTFHCSNKKA